ATVMVAGEVSHELPTGIGIPPTFSLVSCSLAIAVVVTVLALKLNVPVACPTWISLVVAVTVVNPSSLNDPVAGGSVSVAVSVELVRSAVEASVPGPGEIDVLIFLMNVLPVTGNVRLMTWSAGADRLARAGVADRPIPATATVAVAVASNSVNGPRIGLLPVVLPGSTLLARKPRFHDPGDFYVDVVTKSPRS